VAGHTLEVFLSHVVVLVFGRGCDVVANRQLIGVALRASRVLIRWNEELVSVLVIAVRVMAGGAGQQPGSVPVVVGPDEVRVLLVVRLRIE